MTTKFERKLMNLLDTYIPDTVLLASWLEKNGVSRELQRYYLRSGWLESIGVGAFKRPKDIIKWEGAMFSLQFQAQLPIHIGGLTSLSLQGLAHYLRLANETLYVYSPLQTKLPKWFLNHEWGLQVKHVKTSSLPRDLALFEFIENNIIIRIASPERAILECLYLAPDQIDLVECYQVLEGLTNLRPKLLQEILEKCTSIKVKRLFLLMAERAKHQWFPFIDQAKINMGKGDRSIVKGGVYVSKYRISVPKELVES